MCSLPNFCSQRTNFQPFSVSFSIYSCISIFGQWLFNSFSVLYINFLLWKVRTWFSYTFTAPTPTHTHLYVSFFLLMWCIIVPSLIESAVSIYIAMTVKYFLLLSHIWLCFLSCTTLFFWYLICHLLSFLHSLHYFTLNALLEHVFSHTLFQHAAPSLSSASLETALPVAPSSSRQAAPALRALTWALASRSPARDPHFLDPAGAPSFAYSFILSIVSISFLSKCV